jgi:hypothetical protein
VLALAAVSINTAVAVVHADGGIGRDFERGTLVRVGGAVEGEDIGVVGGLLEGGPFFFERFGLVSGGN